jgi:hypothetical protein
LHLVYLLNFIIICVYIGKDVDKVHSVLCWIQASTGLFPLVKGAGVEKDCIFLYGDNALDPHKLRALELC